MIPLHMDRSSLNTPLGRIFAKCAIHLCNLLHALLPIETKSYTEKLLCLKFLLYPPLKKEGHIALHMLVGRSVCQSVCRYPLTLCN